MNVTKTQIDFWCFEGYFQYRIFEVIDGRKQIYYIAEPAIPSATRIADMLDELKATLEKDVARLVMLKKRER